MILQPLAKLAGFNFFRIRTQCQERYRSRRIFVATRRKWSYLWIVGGLEDLETKDVGEQRASESFTEFG
jgi:hypothetical protein